MPPVLRECVASVGEIVVYPAPSRVDKSLWWMPSEGVTVGNYDIPLARVNGDCRPMIRGAVYNSDDVVLRWVGLHDLPCFSRPVRQLLWYR